jgi:multiple sugar transport system permease protein
MRAAAAGHEPPVRSRPTLRKDLVGLLWISPWIIGFLAFMLLPIAMSLYYSLTDYNLLEAPLWVGISNYARLLRDAVFGLALRNTFVYAVFSIPLCTVLAIVIAALLNARLRLRAAFRAAVFVPSLVPIAATAMVWMWLFNGEYGLINQAISIAGIRGPNWLQDAGWVMPALVLMSVWGIGQAVVTYLAALQAVPESLYEAAALDGMGVYRRFWHVTLPLISPLILFNVITLTIATVQVFAVPYVLSKAAPGGPDREMYFLTMYMYDNAFVFGQMGYASALAWVQLLIILGLTGLMFLASRRIVYYRAG